ncbi:MAG: fibrobacter succinogenes major paralogous domain-containing protein [Bacteroidetes bacterium]|nr:fibrobacter succinogenes major paralogous domain-containing protein [Bacteroidota bacterium]
MIEPILTCEGLSSDQPRSSNKPQSSNQPRRDKPRSGVISITVGEAHGCCISWQPPALKGRHIITETVSFTLSPFNFNDGDQSANNYRNMKTKMTKAIYTTAMMLLFAGSIFAQNGNVGINNDGSTPAASAMLDVSSTTKGFLPPRMTTAQRNAISSLVPGLVIYNTDDKALNVFNGTSWGLLNTVVCGQSFNDPRDGKVYTTVQIGDQCWMAKNLAYLPSVVSPGTGDGTSTYYYVYGYNGTVVANAKATANYQTYGVLYNWPSSLTACPTGWHLPTDAEWSTLTTNLGGEMVAGGKLKEAGTTHWQTPNEGATNESGFTALPAGYRDDDGTFYHVGNYGIWWSSTESDTSFARDRVMPYNDGGVSRDVLGKSFGFSVRCLRNF